VALNELRLAVARVVSEFVIELGDGYSEERYREQWKDYIATSLGTCELRFKARE
jgi:hypothetical protein